MASVLAQVLAPIFIKILATITTQILDQVVTQPELQPIKFHFCLFALFFLVQLLSLQTRLFNMITKQATLEDFTIVFFQAEYYLDYINPSLLLYFSFISDADPSFTPSKAIASNLLQQEITRLMKTLEQRNQSSSLLHIFFLSTYFNNNNKDKVPHTFFTLL